MRGDEALALARRAQDPVTIAEALLARAGLEMTEPLPQRTRRKLADEALAVAREADDERLVAFALAERATTHEIDEASPEFEEAAAALEGIGASRFLANLYWDAAYLAIKDGCHERAGPLLDRARPLVRELGERKMTAFFSGNDGLDALFNGDVDRAHTAFQEQARLCGDLVLTWLACEAFGGLAAVATQRNDAERAARLLGAASVNGPIADPEIARELEEKFFEAARAHCGEPRWGDAYAAGRRMSFQDAIALAVES
jgi:hypothetical protein